MIFFQLFSLIFVNFWKIVAIYIWNVSEKIVYLKQNEMIMVKVEGDHKASQSVRLSEGAVAIWCQLQNQQLKWGQRMIRFSDKPEGRQGAFLEQFGEQNLKYNELINYFYKLLKL